MQIFSRRPLFCALFVFLAADLLFTFISPEIRSVIAAACFGVLALVFLYSLIKVFRGGGARILLPALLCAVALAGALLCAHGFADGRLARIENRASPAVIGGQIRKCERIADYEGEYIADIDMLDGDRFSCALLLIFSDEISASENDRFTAIVQIEPFSDNEYGFNTRAYRISDGVFARATVLSYHADAVGTPRWQTRFEEIARAIEKHFDRRFDDDSAALSKALLLGDKDDLAGTFKRDIRRLGVSHILAVSGTHFSVLLGMATLILSLFQCPPRVTRILLILLSLCYMAITGFSPSVVRAGLMAVCGFIAFLCGRQKDALTALAASVAVFLVLTPHVVYSVGLWLSFSATFVILLFLEAQSGARLRSGNLPLRLLWLILCRVILSALIFAVTLPICALAFGEVSIASILGNLTVVPLLEIYIYIIAAASLLPPLSPLIGFVTLYTKGVMLLTEKLADHEHLLVSVQYGFVLPILCIGLFASFLLACLRLNRRRFILLPLLLSLTLTAGGIFLVQKRDHSRDSLYFFSCFGGDGILLKSQNRTLLLDASTGQNYIRYQANYISGEVNCPEIYGLMLTHYHQKHISSLRALCTSQKLMMLYLPPCTDTEDTDIHDELVRIAERYGVAVSEIGREVPIAFGQIGITLCEPQKIGKSTHPAYAVWLDNRERTALYCPASASDRDDFTQGASPDYLLVGFHTPRQKSPFAPMDSANLLFANEDLAALSTRDGAFAAENGFLSVDLY
ncbi:MAG: ComEC/Rec2 family competence protein [Clostridia bacterium]|nr:ComEC/Rec2 family competence protein [Clostridia bacterium]